ncbi:MAG: CotH kinase family protein [Granulosicoccus sp.]
MQSNHYPLLSNKRAQLSSVLLVVCALVTGCTNGTSVNANPDDEPLVTAETPDANDAPTPAEEIQTPPVEQPPAGQPLEEQQPEEQQPEEQPPEEEEQPPTQQPPVVGPNGLQTPSDLFERDGYGSIDVVRIDVRTATSPGVCTEEDMSGCTLADVNGDVDIYDNFEPEIEVQLQAADYPNDGSTSNAELRQRGATARQFPQKSYRVKIDKGTTKWRNERRLQLNKHPADVSRIRNKLSFDLMTNVPHLPSLRTQFVNLWVDDGQGPVDLGLFTHVEALHKEFLENRGWGEDDNIYKAEAFTFSAQDLEKLAVDETGAPLNEELFEERLSVKTGADDHRQLIAMLTAMNDPTQSFDSILDRYFDRDNVLAWVTVNFLIGQKDITTHNFYLYNPAGTEKFYFLPWDYDAAFYIETEPENSFTNDDLDRRLFYGYARGSNSVFLDRYFRLPGINDTIVNAANTLRAGPLSDAEIKRRTTEYGDVVRPFTTRMPDVEHLSAGNDREPVAAFERQLVRLSEYVITNLQVMQEGLRIPMPHTLNPAVREGDQWVLSWTPAHDPTGNTISYDIQIATDVTFPTDSIVFDMNGIADDPNNVRYAVPATSLPDAPLFYRVVARASSDPERYWQVSTNILKLDGNRWLGVQKLE